jgi:hypothetical protein
MNARRLRPEEAMMDATVEKMTTQEHYLAVDGARRAPLVALYQRRLAYLLGAETADQGDLTAEERRLLRTQAVLRTVHTLTAMGEGTTASELLRQGGRREPAPD